MLFASTSGGWGSIYRCGSFSLPRTGLLLRCHLCLLATSSPGIPSSHFTLFIRIHWDSNTLWPRKIPFLTQSHDNDTLRNPKSDRKRFKNFANRKRTSDVCWQLKLRILPIRTVLQVRSMDAHGCSRRRFSKQQHVFFDACTRLSLLRLNTAKRLYY